MSAILFNMFLLKKGDVEKFNRAFNTITMVLEDIYTETRTLSRTLNKLNGYIKKVSSINGNVVGSTTVKGKGDFSKILVQNGTWLVADKLSKAFPKNKTLAVTARVTKLLFKPSLAILPVSIANSLASYSRKRYQDDYAPVDMLKNEVQQPFKQMDALVNTFKINAGVDIEPLSDFLIGLKNDAAIEGSGVDTVLKEQGIDIYDDKGQMNNMSTILSKLANKLENMSEKDATEVKLALGMDSDTFSFLRKGQENFDGSYKEQMRYARDGRPMEHLMGETRVADAKWNQAKKRVKSIFSAPFEWLGEVWTAGQNSLKNFGHDVIMGATSSDEQSEKSDSLENNINNSLVNGSNALGTAQQSSQILLNAGAQASISHSNQVSNQNTFNIVSTTPVEVGHEVKRVLNEEINSISQDANEFYNDGVLK